jgi:hypothetical protein
LVPASERKIYKARRFTDFEIVEKHRHGGDGVSVPFQFENNIPRANTSRATPDSASMLVPALACRLLGEMSQYPTVVIVIMLRWRQSRNTGQIDDGLSAITFFPTVVVPPVSYDHRVFTIAQTYPEYWGVTSVPSPKKDLWNVDHFSESVSG